MAELWQCRQFKTACIEHCVKITDQGEQQKLKTLRSLMEIGKKLVCEKNM